MSTAPIPRARIAAYLERLRDVLPTRQAASVLTEVSALIEDRVELEGGADAPGAVDRALAALGPPERLAAALTGETVSGDVARRVAFGRLVPLVFAAHLVLAIVLTLAGAGTAFVPGIVGALPMESPIATGFGVLGIFFTDVGLVAVTLGGEGASGFTADEQVAVPGSRVTVEGHTDSDPIKKSKWDSNEALSLARAEEVKKLLRQAGVGDNRISAVGMGARQSVARGSTERAKAQNRRVEIFIYPASN